ncbi:MAG: hypothetical protein JNK79_06685 [Chitinophagaceae bacterium]|nr:hypothetical protein [Chitinophagaceae bacterium]
MSESYYYHDIPVDKDNNVQLPECCTQPEPDGSGCTDCCYDEWKKELQAVNQRYAREKDKADLVQKQINFLTERKSHYSKWFDEIEYAEELSRNVCIQLEILLSQTHKIWYNTCNANKAIKKLFCMIRDFFLEVDYIKCRYDELWACILKSTDPSLQEDKGIRSCLKNYSEKLDAVLKLRDDMVKLMVDAIKFSQLMRNNLNTFCCPDDKNYNPCKEAAKEGSKICENNKDTAPDKYAYGFKSIICHWYSFIGCEECKSNGQPDSTQTAQVQDSYDQNARSAQADKAVQANTTSTPEATYECCTIRPTFHLPLCKDDYKGKVMKWRDNDVKTLTKLFGQISTLNKNKEGLLACKTSLTKAMEEADPKLRCK